MKLIHILHTAQYSTYIGWKMHLLLHAAVIISDFHFKSSRLEVIKKSVRTSKTKHLNFSMNTNHMLHTAQYIVYYINIASLLILFNYSCNTPPPPR